MNSFFFGGVGAGCWVEKPRSSRLNLVRGKGLEVGLGWVDESANTCTLANVNTLHFSYLYVCSQSLVPHSPTEWVNIWVHRERQFLTVWMGLSRKHTLQHF